MAVAALKNISKLKNPPKLKTFHATVHVTRIEEICFGLDSYYGRPISLEMAPLK